MSDMPLLGKSKAKILLLLRTKDRTAADIGSSLHMQVSAARKHLEQLTDLDMVTETFHKGTVGRPKKFYVLTEEGREMFPRTYGAFLNKVLAKLVEREGPSYTELLMKTAATDTAKSLFHLQPQDGERAGEVQADLNRLGFEATLESSNGTLTVISENCPIWQVAQAQGEVVCRGYHAELLKASFRGRRVDRQEWMVDGDNYCRHVVTLEPK